MANPIKDISGMIGAKVRKVLVNRRLKMKLNDDIGPEGIVGLKNMDINYGRISRLVNADKQEEAAAYSKDQALQVKIEVQKERALKAEKRYKRLPTAL